MNSISGYITEFAGTIPDIFGTISGIAGTIPDNTGTIRDWSQSGQVTLQTSQFDVWKMNTISGHVPEITS